MKSFGKIVLLLAVNILVSVLATLAVLYYWENIRNAEQPYTLVSSGKTDTNLHEINPPENIDYGIIATETSAILPDTAEPSETLAPAITSQGGILPPVRGAMITISHATGIGDVNAEAVQITSTSDTAVSLTGWTMEDADGNLFTFPDIQLIRNGVFIEVYSRSGHNTPLELYWGQANPVWQSGETIVIRDAAENAQATYRIP